MIIKAICAAAAGLVVMAAASSAADAQSKRRGNVVGYVTTCSTYGNGCSSAPVRRGRHGYEIRLKGGTWVSCRRNCRNSLREETVDFWETQRENQRD